MAYKILVVDDEVTLVNTVRAYLENEGYVVRTSRVLGTIFSEKIVRLRQETATMQALLAEFNDGMKDGDSTWSGTSCAWKSLGG